METLYENGTIITMEEDHREVEAIVINDDKIVALGSKEEMEAQYPNATRVDLKKKTMMPAFLDAHSHFTGVANSLRLCDLSAVTSFPQLVSCMKEFAKKHGLSSTDWIIGTNYDHNFMEEKKHPDASVLNQISMCNPVYITHASSHMGVANDQALQCAGIDLYSEDPKGGKYGRYDDGRLNGYMEESAFLAFQSHVSKPSIQQFLDLYKEAQQIYASYGITTVQEGFTPSSLFQLLMAASKQDTFYLDVIAYLDAKEHQASAFPQYQQYQQHLRIGGYKTFLDGSPQGRTAWMQEPYEDSDSYCGYPSLTDEELDQCIEQCIDEKQQLLVHCNGDAAAKQYLDAFERVMGHHPNESTYKPVMIHAQFVKEEELKRMKALDMLPSFFVAHTWYWGDIHIQNFGLQRANRMSSVQTAKQLGLPYTFHNDSPVILPNVMKTIWCAVNRETKNHVSVGKDQAVSVWDALRAVTIHTAYQYSEDARKGSFKVGKQADFIILDENPLTIDKQLLDRIQVLKTYKDGQCIFDREG